jgi:hypothetical protein
MIRVEVDLWLWLKEDEAQGFDRPSPMRAVRSFRVPPGSSLGDLLRRMADRHPALGARLLGSDWQGWAQNLTFILNDRVVPLARIETQPLQDGDRLKVTPYYAGG